MDKAVSEELKEAQQTIKQVSDELPVVQLAPVCLS